MNCRLGHAGSDCSAAGIASGNCVCPEMVKNHAICEGADGSWKSNKKNDVTFHQCVEHALAPSHAKSYFLLAYGTGANSGTCYLLDPPGVDADCSGVSSDPLETCCPTGGLKQ